MILQRARQFARAIAASLSEEDEAFIAERLSREQAELFFKMSIPDRCHAVSAARTAKSLAEGAAVDTGLLVRAALLHDVGRREGDLGTLGKSFAVVFDAVCGKSARELGRSGGPEASWLGRKLFIYYHHAEIGAKLLRDIGCGREAEIVQRHHDAPDASDPPELRMLRMADEMN